MNINDIDDRKKFEEERLYPSLKLLYSGIMGQNVLHPIIVGSTAMYLQGIYLDKFPNDIDVKFFDIDDLRLYNALYRKLCKKYGFSIDFLKHKNPNVKEYNIIKINDIDVYVETIPELIRYQIFLYEYWQHHDNEEKAQKYLNHYNHIKEHYPQYFKEQNPET